MSVSHNFTTQDPEIGLAKTNELADMPAADRAALTGADLLTRYVSTGMRQRDFWRAHLADVMTFDAFHGRIWRAKKSEAPAPQAPHKPAGQLIDVSGMLGKLDALVPRVEPIEDCLLVHSDNAIITSDWHWPLTDPRMVSQVLLTAMADNIKSLYIIGDTTNMDELSSWPVKVADQHIPLRVQFRRLRKTLMLLRSWFDDIIITDGNHDERLQLSTAGHISLADFLYAQGDDEADDIEGVPGIQFSLYRYMWLKTSERLMLAMHPENYRAVSMALAQDFATTYVPPAPYQYQSFGVLIGHTHVASYGYTKNGLHPAIGMGAMFDQSLATYKRRGGNKAVQWNKAFVRLRDGYFSLLTDGHVDWRREMGRYYADYLRLV